MSIQEVSAERLAELFYHYHQSLGADCGAGSDGHSESWNAVSPQEKHRQVTAARLALLNLQASSEATNQPRRYFATPGEAEWGC